MVEFLQEYGSYILSVIIIILDLVIFPIVKGKLNKSNKKNALFSVVEKLPDYILEAENLFDRGKSKLAYVLQKVHLDCVALGIDFNEEVFTSYVEDILETPQSHN